MLSGRVRGALALAGMIGVAVGGQAGTRVVERGETLSGVARSVGVPVDELARANGITDPDRLPAGRRLVVPDRTAPPAAAAAVAPATVEVARGQTLSAVARSLGVGVDELARANGIRDVNRVRAGRRLVVPAGPAPSPRVPEALRALPDRLALLPLFDAAARDFGVPADLFKAMAWQESGWRNDRVSSTAAVGIGQLMPATVAFVNGVLLRAQLDPGRPEDNIRMSARFLAYLLKQNAGDVPRALASYYQGLASVRSRGPLPETVRYVANVLALRQKF